MIKLFKKLGEKFYVKFTDFLNNGGGYMLFAVALTGIAMAIIGHYGLVGFSLSWFLFFELPLYIFCAWALWQAFKMYKNILKK